MLRFNIIKYCQTRSITYRWYELEQALRRTNLLFITSARSMIVQIDAKTIDERKLIEYEIKKVHRKIPYFIQQIEA